MEEHYRKYGNEGYILQIDLKNYFGSIPHDKLKEMIREKFTDERIIRLTEQFIDAFAEEKMKEMQKFKEEAVECGEEYAIGLGLGSEVCQICAVSYPNRVDHFVKEILRVPYGRYMDDSYLIHISKEFLKDALEKIRGIYESLGIKLNEKKARIVKLSRGFTFLKTQFFLTETGKVVKKICRDSVTRERRKLKKFAKWVNAGKMAFSRVEQQYS